MVPQFHLKMGKIKSNTLKSVRDVLKPYETVFAGDEKPLKTKIIDSPLGPLIVVSNEKSILMIKNAESQNLNRELKQLTKLYSKPIVEDNDSKPLKSIESELDAYFKGDLTEFQTPLEIETSGTEFQRAVWNEINKIKHGKTSTYLELAQRIGKPKSYRAVANACGRNPIPIVIPCHRVLATGGGLGGYTGGVDKKEWLLDHEK